MKQELKEIEDNILSRLSNTEGNPVDDVDLISALQASKAKSQEIQVSQLTANTLDHLFPNTILETLALYHNILQNLSLFLFSCTVHIPPLQRYD